MSLLGQLTVPNSYPQTYSCQDMLSCISAGNGINITNGRISTTQGSVDCLSVLGCIAAGNNITISNGVISANFTPTPDINTTFEYDSITNEICYTNELSQRTCYTLTGGSGGTVGPQGPQGEPGIDGTNGVDGIDGTNGTGVVGSVVDNNNGTGTVTLDGTSITVCLGPCLNTQNTITSTDGSVTIVTTTNTDGTLNYDLSINSLPPCNVVLEVQENRVIDYPFGAGHSGLSYAFDTFFITTSTNCEPYTGTIISTTNMNASFSASASSFPEIANLDLNTLNSVVGPYEVVFSLQCANDCNGTPVIKTITLTGTI